MLGEVPTHAPLSLTTRPFSSTPAQNVLTEISEWLENHPQEGVILACRNSEGMMEDLHEYLKGCIRNIFGDMLCPRGLRRGDRLPVLLAAGALGFTVIRLSDCCMRLIQILGDTAHGTSVIHPPLSPLKYPINLPITAQDTPITHSSPSPLRHPSNLPTSVSTQPCRYSTHDCLFSQRTQ